MPSLDTLSFVGLERSHLRSAVYRRVFGDDVGPVRIGRYSILERIGAGARGVVFKAFDNQLDRPVALKVLATRAGDHDELVREAKALARLSHPNVLAVYEVGETDDGQVFVATEYVKGWTLRGWYDEEHRSEAALVEVIGQVAAGVRAAHDEGLVHRDLKPANILMGHDGRVRVADFGLARFDPSALAPTPDIANDGIATTTAGTPGYMAPELFRGDPASAASDQYALAVTTYELLHGAFPADAEPSKVVSATVRAALGRALSDAPEDRYTSVTDFAEALASRRASGSSQRALLLGAGLTAATLAGFGVVGAALWSQNQDVGATPSADVAILEAKAALPEDPAAALDALRNTDDLDRDDARAVVARALALGPEHARYKLPADAQEPSLWGDLLVYQDPAGTPTALRLHPGRVEAVDLSAVGLVEQASNEGLDYRMFGGGHHFDHDGTATMAEVAPVAARSFSRSHRQLAISADGRRVARLKPDPVTITVTDTKTGAELWSITRPDTRSATLSLDAEGRRVAWAEPTGSAFVHDLDSDTTYAIEPAASEVLFVQGRDSVIVRGRYTGLFEVRLYDGRVTRLVDDDAAFGHVEVSTDGRRIVAQHSRMGVAAVDQIFVSDINRWKPRSIVGDYFAMSPSGRKLAVAKGATLQVHDLDSGDSQTLTVPGGPDQVDFADDETLWVLGSDKALRHYTLEDPHVLAGHTAPIAGLALSKDGRTAVSTSRDFTIRLWDVDAGTHTVIADVLWGPDDIAFDDARGQIVVAGAQESSSLFDTASGELLAELPHAYGRAQLAQDGSWVGAGKTGVWRYDGNAVSSLFDGKCGSVAVLDGQVSAVCGDGPNVLHTWQDDGEHTTVEFESMRIGGRLHVWPNDDHLLHLGTDPRLFQRDSRGTYRKVETPPLLASIHPYWVLAASDAAHDLVALGEEGPVEVWPDGTLNQIAQLDTSLAIALSGDGRRVAYASDDEHVIIVRDRPVSRSTQDLRSVLEAHTVTEGTL